MRNTKLHNDLVVLYMSYRGNGPEVHHLRRALQRRCELSRRWRELLSFLISFGQLIGQLISIGFILPYPETIPVQWMALFVCAPRLGRHTSGPFPL